MLRFRLRSLTIAVTIIAMVICGALRIYHSFIPRGAEPLPFLIASVDGGTIKSPNGVEYQIWFNDAGAMHSGAHWTWVTSSQLVCGRVVVTEGYLGGNYAIEKQAIPVSWKDDLPVIQFMSGRYKD